MMQYLEVIRKEAAHLEKITNDFLDFARLETGRLKLNLSATDLEADAVHLRRAFSNLLENALKYSPRGTTVSIELEDLKSEI
ncbi:MAG: hypothetical protein C4525_14635, partial [Desulfarculus sp.]